VLARRRPRGSTGLRATSRRGDRDRYGRRTALLAGLAILAGAFLAPLILGSPKQIIAARALRGAGAAFMMPATLSSLTVAYPPRHRQTRLACGRGLPKQGDFRPARDGRVAAVPGMAVDPLDFRARQAHAKAEKTVCRGDTPVRYRRSGP
jgi:hypothetical protein